MLEIISSVKNLAPFAKLADSLVSSLPSNAGIIRALALGWAPTPWSDTARRWLQGQDLPEADLHTIGLKSESPTALDVLQAIPALFHHTHPMIICCDQLEGILQGEQKVEASSVLGQSLMDLLQKIPCQIVVSCFQDKWDQIYVNFLTAFRMRVRTPPFRLESLKADQAVRLVASRIASWPERPTDKPPTWPFGEATLRQIVAERVPTPRGLILECGRRFDTWLEGDQTGEIPPDKTNGPVITDPTFGFLAEWNHEIAEIKRDPERSAIQQSEDRLYRGVLEALKLAQSAQRLREFGGVRIVEVQDKVIKATAPLRRPGALITLAGGPGESPQSVVVALTTIESAQSFNYYLKALKVQTTPVAGALLIHPRRDLNLGTNAQTYLEAEQKNGRFRLLALEDHPLTYQALEAFVALLERANGRELIINGLTLTPDDCRDLVIKTGVIDNLDLFKLLGHSRKIAVKPEAAPSLPAVPSQAQGESEAANKATMPPPKSGFEAKQAAPPHPSQAPTVDHSAWAEDKLARAVKKLKLLGQEVQGDGFEVGPTFARLRVVPLGKTNFKGVSNKAVDLRISLGLEVVPIVGSQAGCISIDIQRPDRMTLSMVEALASAPASMAKAPAFPVGVDVAGQPHWLNLAEPSDCHLLVAGTTGSGKSEFLRAAVAALASRMRPDQVQFLLIDPKRVTFNLAQPGPYLQAPVAHDLDEALPLIEACMKEMDRRYAILEERKLSNVSELPADLLPRIVVVIDEFAGFLEDKESKNVVTTLMKRIGAMGRVDRGRLDIQKIWTLSRWAAIARLLEAARGLMLDKS